MRGMAFWRWERVSQALLVMECSFDSLYLRCHFEVVLSKRRQSSSAVGDNNSGQVELAP